MKKLLKFLQGDLVSALCETSGEMIDSFFVLKSVHMQRTIPILVNGNSLFISMFFSH